MITEITNVTHEAETRLGHSPEDRYITRALRASRATANVVVTLGVAKGWRYACKAGNLVKLWIPGSGSRTVTYSLTNAALWRAIKNRGLSLTQGG